MNTIIPVITDPLGKYWNQPNVHNILMNQPEEVAIMDEKDFNLLSNYSHSIPSGVYIGKCWKSKFRNGWLLCWYDLHPDPKLISIKSWDISII